MKRLILASNQLPVHINWENGKYQIEKEEETIKELISWCYEGPPASQVDDIKTSWQNMLKEECESFEIRY